VSERRRCQPKTTTSRHRDTLQYMRPPQLRFYTSRLLIFAKIEFFRKIEVVGHRGLSRRMLGTRDDRY